MPKEQSSWSRRLGGAVNLLGSGLGIWTAMSGLVVAAIGGVFDQIQEWNQPWRTLFWVSLALLVVNVLVRTGRFIRAQAERRRLATELDVPAPSSTTYGTTFIRQEGGTLSAPGALMISGQEAPSRPPGFVASNPDELRKLGSALRDVGREVSNLAAEFNPMGALLDPTTVPVHERPDGSIDMPRLQADTARLQAEANVERERRESAMYGKFHEAHAPHAIFLYQLAAERGFTDQEVDRFVRFGAATRLDQLGLHLTALGEKMLFMAGD